MKKLALAALLALSASLAADGASAAPANIPARPIDLDLKQASAKNVFSLLGSLAQRPITVDPCVTTTIDLRLKNTPLPVVFDVLAAKLGLVYEERADDSILVHCKAPDDDGDGRETKLTTRVTVSASEAPLSDVVDQLARSAKLGGVDYRATRRPRVTVTLKDVRLGTAVNAVAESSGVNVAVRGDRLVVD